jgi:DNA-directed RNA polymerase specialized sigma24 family protein
MIERLAGKEYLNICKSITGGSDLAGDLHHETLLVIHKIQPNTFEDAVKLFKYIAHRQWNEYGRFSTLYNHKAPDFTITDMADEENTTEPTKYQKFIVNLLELEPQDDRQLVIFSIVKLRLQGYTLREIGEELNINHVTAQKAIKQFESDVRNGNYSDICSDIYSSGDALACQLHDREDH